MSRSGGVSTPRGSEFLHGSANLYSAKRRNRVIVPMPESNQVMSGTLMLHPVGRRRRVIIDGFALVAH